MADNQVEKGRERAGQRNNTCKGQFGWSVISTWRRGGQLGGKGWIMKKSGKDPPMNFKLGREKTKSEFKPTLGARVPLEMKIRIMFLFPDEFFMLIRVPSLPQQELQGWPALRWWNLTRVVLRRHGGHLFW